MQPPENTYSYVQEYYSYSSYLKPSSFSGTLNLVIFVGNDLAYLYLSDFIENFVKILHLTCPALLFGP